MRSLAFKPIPIDFFEKSTILAKIGKKWAKISVLHFGKSVLKLYRTAKIKKIKSSEFLEAVASLGLVVSLSQSVTL